MAQIILGLDIGQSVIKGVRIARTLRGLRLVDAFERKVERQGERRRGDLPDEAQIEALRQLRSEGKIKPGEMTAIALPGHLVSTREITVPFTDPKRLRQVVPFEVEGQLPFDLEEVVIDYQPLPQGGGRDLQIRSAPEPGKAEPAESSRLLVSAVPKGVLRRYLSALQSVGIDPAWVGVDALSLYTFYQQMTQPSNGEKKRGTAGGDERSEHLLIDLGASKTVLCGLSVAAKQTSPRLRWVRTIPIGSDDFTEAFQHDLGLSWEEAEKRKNEIDLSAPPRTEAGEAVQKRVSSWLIEIEKSVSLTGGANGEPRSGFYLCGGGGQWRGLKELIAQHFQMTPETLSGSPPMAGLDTAHFSTALPRYAEALGLALSPAQGTQINFRQGEFVFGKESIERRHRLTSVGLVSLILLGLIGGDFYLHYHQKEKKFQALKQELRSEFTKTFPQTKNVSNEVEQTRAAINERKKNAEFLGVGEESPLEVLKVVTAGIPTEVRIDVTDMVIDGNKIRIEAQTDSYDSVDRIRGGLMKVGHFQEVNVSDAKISADQSKVGFRIQLTMTEGKKDERKRSS
ncbi:MAG: pilus assembly protein PilM [Candidatus Manganitrophus sp. SB1]|nr:pilus assembly protein PilM [Candidatus Manganitrophus morganii]